VVLVENVVGSTVFVALAGLEPLGVVVGTDPPLSPSPVESCAGVVLGTAGDEVLTDTEDEDAVGAGELPAGELPALSVRGLGPGMV